MDPRRAHRFRCTSTIRLGRILALRFAGPCQRPSRCGSGGSACRLRQGPPNEPPRKLGAWMSKPHHRGIELLRKDARRAVRVATRLGITVRGDSSIESAGRWPGSGRTVYVNHHHANAYVVLHEIGHVLCGLMCCREHCEYAAHGAAMALARQYRLPISQQDRRRVDSYAGRSARASCGAVSERRKGNRCKKSG